MSIKIKVSYTPNEAEYIREALNPLCGKFRVVKKRARAAGDTRVIYLVKNSCNEPGKSV